MHVGFVRVSNLMLMLEDLLAHSFIHHPLINSLCRVIFLVSAFHQLRMMPISWIWDGVNMILPPPKEFDRRLHET